MNLEIGVLKDDGEEQEWDRVDEGLWTSRAPPLQLRWRPLGLGAVRHGKRCGMCLRIRALRR